MAIHQTQRAAIALVFALSIWLGEAFPAFAVAPAVHDDALFVRLAQRIAAGDWLGPYDNLTHAKGAGYPAFIAVTHWLGVPLKLAEHAAYLAAALYFSVVAGAIFRSRALTLAMFVLLAFNPALWSSDAGGRVVRENIYSTLSLLLLALCARGFLMPRRDPSSTAWRANAPVLAAIGAVGALFWLTREEGVWLLPSIAILVAGWLIARAKQHGAAPGAAAREVALFLGLPCAVFAAAVAGVNATNLVKYGTYRNNDFRSDDFLSAYGALARIRHQQWAPYVVVPREARQRAYAVSPAASELQPYLEGAGGELWRAAACYGTGGTNCKDIHAGWFVWALRDAVAAAGHYVDARSARSYYERLAREVNQACDEGRLECEAPRSTLFPVWRPEYLGKTLRSAVDMFSALAHLGNPRVRAVPSMGSEPELRAFRTMVGGPVSGDEPPALARVTLAQWLARAEVAIASVGLPLAIAAWIVLAVVALRTRRWHPGHVLVAALVAAVAVRVLLLALLDATSLVVNRSLYPTPAMPLALALIACVAWQVGAALRNREFGAPIPT